MDTNKLRILNQLNRLAQNVDESHPLRRSLDAIVARVQWVSNEEDTMGDILIRIEPFLKRLVRDIYSPGGGEFRA